MKCVLQRNNVIPTDIHTSFQQSPSLYDLVPCLLSISLILSLSQCRFCFDDVYVYLPTLTPPTIALCVIFHFTFSYCFSSEINCMHRNGTISPVIVLMRYINTVNDRGLDLPYVQSPKLYY